MTFLGLLLIEYQYYLILIWVVFLFKSAVCLTKITLHKISSILCKMFWNALYFQRFPKEFNIIPYVNFTAVQISHLLHRTPYHVTQGGALLQIKKRLEDCVPEQNLLQYIVHTELLTMHKLCYCILHPMNCGNHYHTVNV
jgi:hypothetical protein